MPAVITFKAVLSFFAEGGSKKGTGNDFNIQQSKTLLEILKILKAKIFTDLIKLPESDIEKITIELDFYTKQDFPVSL